MPAILKLVPAKVWLWLALLVAGVVYVVHNHHNAEQLASVKQVAIAAQNTDKRVAAAAQTTETQSALIYKQVVSIPPVGDIGIECVRHAPSSGKLPAATPVAAAPTGDTTLNSGGGPTFDPSGALLERARKADAQIAYLQRRIQELETEMKNAP
jgi:hypothetical protein